MIIKMDSSPRWLLGSQTSSWLGSLLLLLIDVVVVEVVVVVVGGGGGGVYHTLLVQKGTLRQSTMAMLNIIWTIS